MSQTEMDFIFNDRNISLRQLWVTAYGIEKKRAPKPLKDEDFEDYKDSLFIGCLFEFSEQIRKHATQLLLEKMEDDEYDRKLKREENNRQG